MLQIPIGGDTESGSPRRVSTEAVASDGVVDHPEISFVIAAYNVAPYIASAISSALGQAGVAVEVIVVDDASTDGTAEIVASIAACDARVKLLRQASNAGPSAARNRAISAARGTWIAILDGDDLILPERSRRLIDLAITTSADIVADNFERIDLAGQPTGKTMLPDRGERHVFSVDGASFILGNVVFDRRASLGALKPLIRRSFLGAHRIAYADHVRIGEDYLLCLACLVADARFVVSSERLYQYRVRPGSISWRLGIDDIDRWRSGHAQLDVSRLGPAAVGAAARFDAALVRARQLTVTIDHAKRGRWIAAIAQAIAYPAVWPLSMRIAVETMVRRLLRTAGPPPARTP